MSRRIEIQPAPHRMARVEMWLGNRCTSMSGALPLEAARLRAETLAGATAEIVDHTEYEFAPVNNKRNVSFS